MFQSKWASPSKNTCCTMKHKIAFHTMVNNSHYYSINTLSDYHIFICIYEWRTFVIWLSVNDQILHITIYRISNTTNHGVKVLAITFLPIITSLKHHILHVPSTDDDVNVVYTFDFTLGRNMKIKIFFWYYNVLHYVLFHDDTSILSNVSIFHNNSFRTAVEPNQWSKVINLWSYLLDLWEWISKTLRYFRTWSNVFIKNRLTPINLLGYVCYEHKFTQRKYYIE